MYINAPPRSLQPTYNEQFVDFSTDSTESNNDEASPPLDGRLDSWKSIAAYLGREVRTVQRWEKTERLPIHRHLHAKLGSVYAYTAELREWQNSRRITLLKEVAVAPEQAAPVAPVTFTELALEAAPVPKATSILQKWFLAVVGACCLLGLFQLLTHESHRAPTIYNPVPLTTYRGRQDAPSFSPDGSSIAYAWSSTGDRHFDVYTEVIGSSKPVKLNTTPGDSFHPAWSPDGKWIAFLRSQQDGQTGLWIHSLPKKTDLCIRQLAGDYGIRDRTLSWTPDSEGLIVPEFDSASRLGGLYYVPLRPGAGDIRLTKPGIGQGDANSAISPNGRQLIFTRFFSSGVSHLCTLQLSTDHTPIDSEKTIDWPGFAAFSSASPAFWGNGGDLLFISNRNGGNQIWRSHNGEQSPELAGLPAGNISNLAVSARSDRLAYSLDRNDANVWRIDAIQLMAKRSAEPERVIASTEMDQRPQVAPDGNQVAFESDRSGAFEIWKFNLKTGESLQVTHLRHTGTGSPAWSPDSKEIAFDARITGKAEIYKMPASGGTPVRLTNNPSTDMLPTWSNDGRWVYFSSNRSGSNQIWRVSANGGNAEQITRQGGLASRMSQDGAFLYFTRGFQDSSLWRVQPSGGEETQVIRSIVGRGFALGSKGIFFIAPLPQGREELCYLTLAAKTVQPLFTFRGKVIPPISFDGKFLYFSQYDELTSNLMMVEHFQ